MTPLAQRFGCSPGPDLDEGLRWCADHDFRCVVFTTDAGATALGTWPEQRIREVGALAQGLGTKLVIHTLSAVNAAEFVPGMSEAVDAYLAANIDLAAGLGADVIVHAGLQFSERLDVRMRSSLEHLQRAAARAASAGVVLHLENMNNEPEHAEVRYLGHSIDEMRYFLDALPEATVRWAFSANHAQLVPEGFDGFIDAFGADRIGLLLVADCRGGYEEHLLPGQGTLDFGRLVTRLEGAGYGGPYVLTFGPREELLKGRDHILARISS